MHVIYNINLKRSGGCLLERGRLLGLIRLIIQFWNLLPVLSEQQCLNRNEKNLLGKKKREKKTQPDKIKWNSTVSMCLSVY